MKAKIAICVAVVGCSLFLGHVALGAEVIQPAADAPQPMTPEESTRAFQLQPGFRIDLVACEPLIADPTCVAFTADGQLFVCELHGYNLEGHLDVVELNKTGKLDREVRRIQAPPAAKAAALRQTYGTVKLLRDTDGDGRMDTAAIWADKLPACYGILPVRDGLVVTCAPDIVFLADRDGDGKAEVRKTLFTGFETGALERGINNPRWGVDNWVYVSAGAGGGRITGPRLQSPVDIGRVDFRFRPDGSVLEPVTGSNGTFGQAITEFGDRFLITGGAPVLYAIPLAHHYLIRNPHVPTPATVESARADGRVFPTSQPHPWRVARGKDPAWVRFYGERETSAGYFTSACGQTFYDAAAFPESYRHQHYCCEPQQNLIHRSVIVREGAEFRALRAPGEQQSEFLTSSDKWFRPNNLRVGPDGALYIVDMYREIIEDYSAIPRFLQQQYGLNKGSDRGRIWRVSYGKQPNRNPTSLAGAPVGELISHLSHPNRWWRETAQRLLIERPPSSDALNQSVDELQHLAGDAKTPATRVRALAVLSAWDAMTHATISRSLQDQHYGVRRYALQLSEPWLDDDESLLANVLRLRHDADPAVRLQLALGLGESQNPRVIDVLRAMAASHGEQKWMRSAILSSLGTRAGLFGETLIAQHADDPVAMELLPDLVAAIGSRNDAAEVGRCVRSLLVLEGELQTTCFDRLFDSIKSETKPPADAQELVRGLLLGAPSVRRHGMRLARLWDIEKLPEMQELWASAARQAQDDALTVEERQQAIGLLASAPADTLFTTARQLLVPTNPLAIQLATINSLSLTTDERVGPLLLAGWSAYTPAVRKAALRALLARREHIGVLVQAIEDAQVKPTELSAVEQLQLKNYAPEPLQRRVVKLFELQQAASLPASLVADYRAALDGTRDAERGQEVFAKTCTTCHRLLKQGHDVGPDLTGARDRPDETILMDILAPSREIAAGYRSYTVVAENGRIYSGVMASEGATSITLRRDEGVEETILRKDIESLEGMDVSLMPQDLHTKMTPQDVADLLAFLRTTLGAPRTSGRVLFDENTDFVDLLTDGGGQAKISDDRPYSGSVCLAVAPPQRYAARIPDWSFPIREAPVEGEYRFLRIAWRATGAGVMIETAASGQWPSAQSAAGRYVSGKNTTDWQAVELSSDAPREWTVVTIDLWQDRGDFTFTGIAPTALGNAAHFDRIELLRSLE